MVQAQNEGCLGADSEVQMWLSVRPSGMGRFLWNEFPLDLQPPRLLLTHGLAPASWFTLLCHWAWCNSLSLAQVWSDWDAPTPGNVVPGLAFKCSLSCPLWLPGLLGGLFLPKPPGFLSPFMLVESMALLQQWHTWETVLSYLWPKQDIQIQETIA